MKIKITRRNFIKTAALALPVVASGWSTLAKSAGTDDDFVTVRNGRFQRRGKPYGLIGSNFHQAAALADPTFPGGRERLVRELDQLCAIGVANLRALAGTEGPRRMQRRAGEWNEGQLQGLDFLLAEMAKRDMTGVFYLTNFWEWSGGMAVYVHWATGEPIPDPNDSTVENPGTIHMDYAARFYGLPRAQEFFQDHITHVLTRRNTINGRLYREDPTIMAWQLANEPRPGRDGPTAEANLPDFIKWMDTTARFVKALAPRQLVSTGNEGVMGCLGKADVFIKAHQSPAVDYTTLHVWVKNWNWLKEPHLGPQYEEAAHRAMEHIDQHIDLADKLGKPLVMEEFGIGRDDDSEDPKSPTTMRDDYYEKIFNRLLTSYQTGSALQAANFWTWSGTGASKVGINDVLSTDSTTLAVIKEHNEQLAKLLGSKTFASVVGS